MVTMMIFGSAYTSMRFEPIGTQHMDDAFLHTIDLAPFSMSAAPSITASFSAFCGSYFSFIALYSVCSAMVLQIRCTHNIVAGDNTEELSFVVDDRHTVDVLSIM